VSIWNYINKSAAAVAMLKDRRKMAAALESASPEIKSTLQASKCREELPAEYMRYWDAMEFLVLFEPSWNCLTDEERMLLEEFYLGNEPQMAVSARLQQRFGCTPSVINSRRKNAEARLAWYIFALMDKKAKVPTPMPIVGHVARVAGWNGGAYQCRTKHSSRALTGVARS